MQILGRETQDLKSLPAGCPVIQSRCFVAGGLLGDVYPAGGGKSSLIHTAHMMGCIKFRKKKKPKQNQRVVFPHKYPSGELLIRLSLPCKHNSITHNSILEIRNIILHNCRRWTKWTSARYYPSKPCLMIAIKELAPKRCSELYARTPGQLRTFYLKQNRTAVPVASVQTLRVWTSSRLYTFLAVVTSDPRRD